MRLVGWISVAHPPKEPQSMDAPHTYCSWPTGRRPTYWMAIGAGLIHPTHNVQVNKLSPP
jgi:hypothetical protein